MSAYCFFNIRVGINLAKFEDYRSRRVLTAVQLYGGQYVVVVGKCEVIEGTWRPACSGPD
jgi:uncharacterized protein (DUF1330 family)